MKKSIRRLPDSELAVMMALWETGRPMTSAEISGRLSESKSWKITSVLTFLARLAEKRFVSVERHGRTNVYRPLVAEKDYLQQESRTILEKLYGNSLTAFVSSLFDGRAVGEKDLDDLRRYLDGAAGGEKK